MKKLCAHCGQDTVKLNEHYFVHNHVWFSAHGSERGFLCVGCLEEHIERRLTPADFKKCYINKPRSGAKSQRLMNRMGY